MLYISKSELPQAIRNYCKEAGITQKALAARVGVKQQTLNDWCRGKSSPTLQHYEILMQIMEGKEDEKSY